MALPKIEEVRKLSDEEITEEITSVKRHLFDLRLKRATNREYKPHQFKHARHRLGQLMTIERERQLNITRTPKEKQD